MMKKLKLRLDPEALRVESFDVRGRRGEAKGTVDAHSFITIELKVCSEPGSAQCMDTDYDVYSCGNSCVNMCFLTGTQPSCID
jgi:hypothetical protein